MVKPPSRSASASVAGEAFWGLGELLELAGARLGEKITPRTVRLYDTEGLINRPGKDGRRAVYAQRHLLQLLLVRSLARRGLSLSAIAPLVAGDDEALQEQLNKLDVGLVASGPSPENNDTLDCLQNTQLPTAELSPLAVAVSRCTAEQSIVVAARVASGGPQQSLLNPLVSFSAFARC
jgi:DNA-binding transcriptional MerR regulator